MNILIITDLLFEGEFLFENDVFKSLLSDYASSLSSVLRELSKSGHNVLAISPNFSKTAEKPSFSFSEDGFSVLSVSIPAKKGFSLSGLKVFNEVILKNSESLAGLFKPNAVILAEIFPFGSKAAAEISKLFGKTYLNFFFCNPFSAVKLLKNKTALSFYLFSLKREFIRAQKETCASFGFFPNAQKLLSKSKRFYPMYLPVKKDEISPTANALSYRNMLSSFNEGNGFPFVFASPLVKGNGAFEMISLFAETEKGSLIFIGQGAQKRALQKFAAEKGVKNLFFLDEPPKDELSFVLGGVKGLVLTENSLLKGDFAEQISFIKAASCGMPIIASSKFNADFFRETGGSVIIRPHNKESFNLGIRAFFEMSTEDHETLGESLIKFSSEHTPEKFSGDLVDFIDSLRK